MVPWAPSRPTYSQRSIEHREGPAEGARMTRPSWRPSSRVGAGSFARWGGWHCCSGCGCSRSPSAQRRSALRDQHTPHLHVCPPRLPSRARPAFRGGSRGLSPTHLAKTHAQSTTRTKRLQRAQRCSRDRERSGKQDQPVSPQAATLTHTEQGQRQPQPRVHGRAHAADTRGLPGDPVCEAWEAPGHCGVSRGKGAQVGRPGPGTPPCVWREHLPCERMRSHVCLALHGTVSR